MQGTVPIWKVSVVAVCYVAIVVACALFNEVQIRLPLTDYSMRSSKVGHFGVRMIDLCVFAVVERRSVQNEVWSADRATRLGRQSSLFPSSHRPDGCHGETTPNLSLGRSQALFLTSMAFGAVTACLQDWPTVYAVVQGNVGDILLFSSIAFIVALLPIGAMTGDMAQFLAGVKSISCPP